MRKRKHSGTHRLHSVCCEEMFVDHFRHSVIYFLLLLSVKKTLDSFHPLV